MRFRRTLVIGARFFIDFEWTLVTGFSPSVRAEVREARMRPARMPPLHPAHVGVGLHVVRLE